MLSQPKNRKIAAILAFAGAIVPLPLSGFHKFYLGQPRWGLLYMLLAWTPISHVASAIEGVWYLVQDSDEFDRNFNGDITVGDFSPRQKYSSAVELDRVSAIADALRQLDCLREDGLISEYEFEQKRRQLLDRIA